METSGRNCVCYQLLKAGFIICVLSACESKLNGESDDILSNRGALRTVFINELDAGTLIDPYRSFVAQAFIEKSISVCLVRNILCSGYTVQNAQSCSNNGRDFLDTSFVWSTLGLSDRDFGKIAEKFIPFNLDGYFTNVNWHQEMLSWDDLSPLERYEFLVANAQSIDSLHWDKASKTYVTRSGDLRVFPTRGLDTVTKFVDIGQYILPASYKIIVEASDSIYGSVRFSHRTNLIRWSNVCGSTSINDCQLKLKGFLVQFGQDEHHVRISGKLQSRFVPERTPSGRNLHQAYLNQLCSAPPEGHLATVDPLSIKGGNMFTCDNLIFIGTDELCRFQNDALWAASLGLPMNSNIHDVEGKLKQMISKSSNLIWIGRKDVPNCLPISEYTTLSTQPLYHIDLFFHPVGLVDNTNPNHYYLIFGTLEDMYHQQDSWLPQSRKTYASVKKQLSSTLDSLMRDVRAAGYDPKVVKVPILLSFDSSGNAEFMSFCNGESSFGKDGITERRYFMPTYTYQYRNRNGASAGYQAALRKATCTLQNDLHCSVDTIPSNLYTPLSGSHCMIKVLERE